jgi:channel protein (hemolysin III family)
MHASRTREGIAALVVFAASAVLLLSMSGVYHLLSKRDGESSAGTARDVLQRLDHAAIFILIAGTFTPIHAILFKGAWRWGMLAFIWTFAVLGVTLKTIFFRETPSALGLALFLAMGWVGLFSMFAIANRFGRRPIFSLVAGGVVYTIGAAVEGLEPRALVPGVIRAHEIFHVAVIGGLAFHWRFIWLVAGVTGVPTRGHRVTSQTRGQGVVWIEPKPVSAGPVPSPRLTQCQAKTLPQDAGPE